MIKALRLLRNALSNVPGSRLRVGPFLATHSIVDLDTLGRAQCSPTMHGRGLGYPGLRSI